LRRCKNAPNGQFQINGENRAFDNDLLPELPAEFCRFLAVYDGSCTVALPRNDLVFGNFPVLVDFEELVGVSPELREKVARFIVLIKSAEPVLGNNHRHPWNCTNLFAVEAGHTERE